MIMLPLCAVNFFNNKINYYYFFLFSFLLSVPMIMLPRASGGTHRVADPWCIAFMSAAEIGYILRNWMCYKRRP